MTINAIIVEDERLAANRLKRLIEEVSTDFHVICMFDTIDDTFAYMIANGQPDVLFLDINVADGNSFELFEKIDVSCFVIFTTAHDEFAVDAFRKKAIDYLLKPIKKEHLSEALGRVRQEYLKNKDKQPLVFKERILITFGNKLTSLNVKNIAYVYSKNKMSYFYMEDGSRYPSDFRLQDVEKELDSDLFFRANRQCIVHRDAVIMCKRHNSSRLILELKPYIPIEIVVSTDKTKLFKKWIGA